MAWQSVLGGKYEVSRDGQVRNAKTKKHRALSGSPPMGYLNFCARLPNDPRQRTHFVHHLICEAFHGPRPDGFQCSHLNGVPTDNRAVNLRWVTAAENQSHRIAHGTALRGVTHPSSRFKSKAELKMIVDRVNSGETLRRVAADYGVTLQCIHLIAKGKNYASEGVV